MSGVQGTVGKLTLSWKTIPHGPAGVASVEVDGRVIEVHWRRDSTGIWIETPTGVKGYDFVGEASDEGALTYRVIERTGAGEWCGLAFRRAGEAAAAAGGAKKKGMRVRAQMPGKIIRVLVKAGQEVEKGASLLVMEAMKMENEIKAPAAGRVSTVKVTEGQAVETGADLCLME